MLHFIYRDTLVDENELAASSSDSSVFDTLAAKLLAAADKYDLGRLRLLCESYLCKGISVASVASTLALADRHHAMELKAVCLKFAAENLSGNKTSHKNLFQPSWIHASYIDIFLIDNCNKSLICDL